MKRKIAAGLIVCMLMTLMVQPCIAGQQAQAVAKQTVATAAAKVTPFGKHGRLRVKGTRLVDKKGKAVQLQGVSSHGINWDVGKPFVNEATLKTLRDKWNVNCFRVAMYTEDYNGYCVSGSENRKNC